MIVDIKKQTGAKLTSAAAISVAKPSSEVADKTVKIVNGLVSKKALFAKAGVQKLVATDLEHLLKVSNDFVSIAKTKIPDQYTATANKYFDQLNDALAKGIKDFSA
ncbi:hypothetical protein BT63DRAFT_419933 [Microthyrium microscopicum]|uniref:Uncharacterized protein n=1 Tax=Microthyrium microscopicum TaxID=703497 RepID=A0A6A6UQS5_9PEZI|nr:hypothetical protein BT63DRAFT_419933 [Microthyrium microscopicum]